MQPVKSFAQNILSNTLSQAKTVAIVSAIALAALGFGICFVSNPITLPVALTGATIFIGGVILFILGLSLTLLSQTPSSLPKEKKENKPLPLTPPPKTISLEPSPIVDEVSIEDFVILQLKKGVTLEEIDISKEFPESNWNPQDFVRKLKANAKSLMKDQIQDCFDSNTNEKPLIDLINDELIDYPLDKSDFPMMAIQMFFAEGMRRNHEHLVHKARNEFPNFDLKSILSEFVNACFDTDYILRTDRIKLFDLLYNDIDITKDEVKDVVREVFDQFCVRAIYEGHTYSSLALMHEKEFKLRKDELIKGFKCLWKAPQKVKKEQLFESIEDEVDIFLHPYITQQVKESPIRKTLTQLIDEKIKPVEGVSREDIHNHAYKTYLHRSALGLYVHYRYIHRKTYLQQIVTDSKHDDYKKKYIKSFADALERALPIDFPERDFRNFDFFALATAEINKVNIFRNNQDIPYKSKGDINNRYAKAAKLKELEKKGEYFLV
jgi:hypothetical protein